MNYSPENKHEDSVNYTFFIPSAHPETAFMGVILRSKATKNLIAAGSAEILRFAQNDMEVFPDGN
ncbi:MAG: hypothetical protein OES18_09510 [Deltaproteobacteria bacterium]|nr:hypothetical protein [Deltaproteobacteria bacterium]